VKLSTLLAVHTSKLEYSYIF